MAINCAVSVITTVHQAKIIGLLDGSIFCHLTAPVIAASEMVIAIKKLMIKIFMQLNLFERIKALRVRGKAGTFVHHRATHRPDRRQLLFLHPW